MKNYFDLPILVLLSFLLIINSKPSVQCHSRFDNYHLFLGSKTPYRYLANNNASTLHYPGCSAVRLWSFIRHGTRNPGTKVIRRMANELPLLRDGIVDNHKKQQGSLCKDEMKQLLSWKPHVEEADEKRLTHEGEDELLELGERYQMRFPELLPEMYSNSSFRFQYTATQRAKESARHFAIGLFGRKVSRYVWFPEAVYKDPILRFYKLCERWRKDVDKNPDSLAERRKFESGPEVSAMLERVTRRLGFVDPLSFEKVHLMYLTCAFETAWDHRHPSPWCSVFCEDDLKVLEYAEDLEYYWIDGYGFEINHKQACPTFRDMITFFRNNSTAMNPKSVLYFSHAGATMKIIAHLGMYRDSEPLRADNFQSMLENRQWRVSQISSFASNIAFVLYKCGSEEKVLTLHQERPIRLPGCHSVDDLCPLNKLLEVFNRSVNHCTFDEMCKLN